MSVDPYEIISEAKQAENKKAGDGQKLSNDYFSQPQNWNRYVYVWNNPLKNVDPDGKKVVDILIIENKATGGNPAGHTAIAITGRGVFSMGNAQGEAAKDDKNNILGGNVMAYIERESPRRDTTMIIIKTTPEQDAAIAEKLISDAKNLPVLAEGLGIALDNCSVRVNAALDAGKIATYEGAVAAYPGTAMNRAVTDANERNAGWTIINVPKNGLPLSSQKEKLKQFERR